jgi:hypothetical protein
MFNAQAVLDEADDALHAILNDIKAAAVEEAKATAPVVSGEYRDGLQATDDGIYGAADHSIFVELKRNIIANAVESAKTSADSIASKHKV